LLLLSLLGADPISNRVGAVPSASKKNASEWQTAARLETALSQPVVANWQNAELRSVLKALADQRHVAIVLDRRVDPHHSVTLDANNESLKVVLSKLADRVGALVSVTGQTVYIGPLEIAAKFRTLLALRQEEFQEIVPHLPASRRSVFTGQRVLKWNDLDSPADIVRKLIRERDPKLTLRGETLIPYDLWATGETPPLTMAEALQLVLVQFDLTFQLDPSGTSLKIISIPEKVAIERRFVLPKAKAAEISKAVQIETPQLETHVTPDQLTAIGTEEQLEELERIIRSVSSGIEAPKKTNTPAALSKRRVTFQAKFVPLNSILEKLATTGIQFEYDREKLEQDGVKIDQLVEIDVKDAKITEMFDKLFRPAKIAYAIDGLTVKLSAAK
jgi:hypothetical protein